MAASGLHQVDAIYCSSGRDDASGYRQAVSNRTDEGISKCKYLVSPTYPSWVPHGDGVKSIVACLSGPGLGQLSESRASTSASIPASVGQPDTYRTLTRTTCSLVTTTPLSIDDKARSAASARSYLHHALLNGSTTSLASLKISPDR